jgi:hypothetical protein
VTDPKQAAERLLEANEDPKVTLTKKRLSSLTTRQTTPPRRVRTAANSDANKDWHVKRLKTAIGSLATTTTTRLI